MICLLSGMLTSALVLFSACFFALIEPLPIETYDLDIRILHGINQLLLFFHYIVCDLIVYICNTKFKILLLGYFMKENHFV